MQIPGPIAQTQDPKPQTPDFRVETTEPKWPTKVCLGCIREIIQMTHGVCMFTLKQSVCGCLGAAPQNGRSGSCWSRSIPGFKISPGIRGNTRAEPIHISICPSLLSANTLHPCQHIPLRSYRCMPLAPISMSPITAIGMSLVTPISIYPLLSAWDGGKNGRKHEVSGMKFTIVENACTHSDCQTVCTESDINLIIARGLQLPIS